jgi:predicted DNA-binding protein
MQLFDLSNVFNSEHKAATYRLPANVLEEAKIQAKNEGRTIARVVTVALVEYLNKREQQ